MPPVPVIHRNSIKGEDGQIVGAAGLLAKFQEEKERINRSNPGYYIMQQKRNIGGGQQRGKNIRGLRIAARAAKKDGKDEDGKKDKDPYYAFGNLMMGKPSTLSKLNRDLLVHTTNAGLILRLAERKNRLPSEATLRALAKSNTESIALTKQAFDHDPDLFLDNLARRKQPR